MGLEMVYVTVQNVPKNQLKLGVILPFVGVKRPSYQSLQASHRGPITPFILIVGNHFLVADGKLV